MKPRPAPSPVREEGDGELQELLPVIRNWGASIWRQARNQIEDPGSSKEDKRKAVEAITKVWSIRAEKLAYARAKQTWEARHGQRGVPLLVRAVPLTPAKTRNCKRAGDEAIPVRAKQAASAARKAHVVKALGEGAMKVRTWINLRKYLCNTASWQEWEEWGQHLPHAFPSHDELVKLSAKLESRASAAMARVCSVRRQRWQERMATAQKYSWISQKFKAAPSIINVAPKGQEEKVTANVVLIDEAVKGFWGKIWQAGNGGNATAQKWFSDTFTPLEEFQLSALCADELREAVKSMHGAGGACGWAVQELRQARPLFDQLCEVYEAWERAGCLPGCALQADITLVPKAGEEAHYSSMRPISVLSAMYRLYSAARLRKTLFP